MVLTLVEFEVLTGWEVLVQSLCSKWPLSREETEHRNYVSSICDLPAMDMDMDSVPGYLVQDMSHLFTSVLFHPPRQFWGLKEHLIHPHTSALLHPYQNISAHTPVPFWWTVVSFLWHSTLFPFEVSNFGRGASIIAHYCQTIHMYGSSTLHMSTGFSSVPRSRDCPHLAGLWALPLPVYISFLQTSSWDKFFSETAAWNQPAWKGSLSLFPHHAVYTLTILDSVRDTEWLRTSSVGLTRPGPQGFSS